MPFDLDRLESTGQAVPALEGLAARANSPGAGAHFATSSDGTLVYVPGANVSSDVPLEWLGRDGKAAPLRSTPANWTNLLFAPEDEASKLAVEYPTWMDVLGSDRRPGESRY